MKLKIRFPGKLLPNQKHTNINNILGEQPEDQRQARFIAGLLILWLIIFLMGFVKCQAAQSRPLHVGDKVPDITLPDLVNYKSRTLKLSDFKGQVVVLDFWATWCSSCISAFPKMYKLQQEFPGDLQILLVNCRSTRDSRERITNFLEQRKAFYQFPVVLMDTTLEKLFPHQTIPHYVWVKDQVVVAITDASEVNEQNMRRLVADSSDSIPEKTFIRYDIEKPLFSQGNGGAPVPYIYRSELTGYKEGLQPYLGFHYRDDGLVDRIDVLNCSKIGLIKFANPWCATIPADRTLVYAPNPDSFSADSGSRPWKARNCFSYEGVFPPRSRKEALEFMRSDIQKYLGLRADSVRRVSDCLVLTIADSSKLIRAVTGTRPETNINERTGAPVYFRNFSLRSVALQLENKFRIPVLNETGFRNPVNLQIPADFIAEKVLAAGLLKQGIKLSREKRKITFLVISPINLISHP